MSLPAPVVKVRPRVTTTELQYYWAPPASKWVAVGGGSSGIATSTDGLTWTASGNPFDLGQGYGIAWNGSYWVAVGATSQSTVCIAKSADGLTWVPSINNPFTGEAARGIAWNGTYWVAVGASASATVTIATSTDGLTWTPATDNPFVGSVQGGGRGIAWNGTHWVAVGSNAGQTVCIARSTNGMTWTDSSGGGGNNPFTGSGGQGYGIAWNGTHWVAVGSNGDETVSIAKSTDGLTWTASTNNPFTGGQGYGIAWNGTHWVAVGQNTGGTVCIARSTDGDTWTNATNNPFTSGQGLGIAWNGTYWVAVGYNTGNTVTIATSTGGLSWTLPDNNPFPTNQGNGIAYANIPINGLVLESASPSISLSLGPTATTTTITGLTNLTDYSFTIKADISGAYSDPVPFRTVRTSARPLPVATLTKSESIVNGDLSVTFNWTGQADYAWYYVYALKAAAGNQDTIYTGTTDLATLSKTFTGLDPTRAYVFRVQRGNDAGYSAVSSLTTTITRFDPTTVTGLYLWLDAADTAGNGSTVADGTVVSTWTDKSGTTNNGTAAAGATLRTDTLGRYLDFQGASWYNLAASSWVYNEYYTIFIVDKPRAYNANYSLVGRQAASSDSFYIQYAADGIRLSSQGDNAAFGSDFEIVPTSPPINVWCFTNYGGKTVYWNRLVSGKNPAVTNITDSLLSIGAKEAGSEPYYGRMREVLMYRGVMTETNRQAITTYLYTKWFTQPTLIPLLPVDNSAILWLDAADIGTFFQNSQGTIPVTTNNQYIQFWKDKSGFGNNMAMSGAQYITDISGTGLPAFYCQSAQAVQTNGYLQTGDASLFLVGWSAAGITDYFFKHDASGNFALRHVSGPPYIYSWGESPTENNNQYPYGSGKYMFYGTMRKGQLIGGTFINNNKIYTFYTVDTLTMPVSSDRIYLSGSVGVAYFEVIYYNRPLSAAEIQQNVTYLSNKWAMAIPSSAAFTPTALTSLKLWLDSSDSATLLQSGGIVTAWNDKSGLGKNAVPFGSPTVNNGVVFNGSSRYFSLPVGTLPQANYSYYAVADISGSGAIIHGGSKDISGEMWVVATTAGIVISYDFSSWITLTTPLTSVRGIAWNGSYWVAVGFNGGNTVSIVKSTNGMTWTDSSGGGGNNPFSGGGGVGIAWNGTYWVAVGFNGGNTVSIAKSSDGMTWTNATDNPFSGNDGQGNGIAWNGTYWVAVGNKQGNTVSIAKSTDGETWTNATNNPFSGGGGNGIAWNGTYWIAVGANTGNTVSIAKSTDGETWTNSTNNPFSGATGSGNGIAWNGSYWVVVGNKPGYTVSIAKSTDGETWTNSTNNPFSVDGNGIAWFSSYWVAVGSSTGSCAATSTDGLTWTPTTNNPSPGGDVSFQIAIGIAGVHNSIMDIKTVTAAAETLYLAGSGEGNKLVYSTNGINWTAAANGGIFDMGCNALAYSGSIWVAGGKALNTPCQLAYSYNGNNWTISTSGTALFSQDFGVVAVAYGGGIWAAGGGGLNTLAFSPDGINWTASTNSKTIFTTACWVLAYNAGLWVAGGQGTNQMAYSTNGISWIPDISGNTVFTTRCKAIAYGNGRWRAGGEGTNQMAYSTDGINWIADISGNATFTTRCTAVAYAAGLWVAGGQGTNQIAYSSDGVEWTPSATGNAIFTTICEGITYSNGKWIAVGGSTNPIAYSTDGMAWTESANGSAVLNNYGYTVAAQTTPAKTVANTRFESVNVSSLTDTTPISRGTTVIVESLYNGTGKSLFLGGKTGPTDTSTRFQDTANNFIGYDVSGGYMNGIIKEIIVYGVAHTATERKQVETYLKAKWYPSAYAPTGMSLWLDASGAANFTLSGSNIQSWTDKSTQSNNFTQAATWAQPIYSLDPVTGRYGVQFAANAITNGLTSATSPFGTTSSCSIFAVQRYDYSTDEATEPVNGNVCTAYETASSDLVAGWVAVGTGGAISATSTDGLNWTPSSNLFSNNFALGIAWNGSYWIAVGTDGANVSIQKSSDGIIWTVSEQPFASGVPSEVAWNGSYWVAVGGGGNGSTVSIAKSIDGVDWTVATDNPFINGSGLGIAWNGSYWLAVGYSLVSISMVKSTDGITWSISGNPFPGGATPEGGIDAAGVGYGIAWNGSYWIAVGKNSSRTVCIAKSTDGQTWTNSTNNPFYGGEGKGIAWNGTYWVAVGRNAANTINIAKSTDGLNWTPSTNTPFSGNDGIGNTIAWNSSYWIAGGRNGANTVSMAKSSDGLTWTNATNSPFSPGSCSGVAYGSIRRAPVMTVGTAVTGTPSTSELNMEANGYGTAAMTVEIHSKPVLTSQILTSGFYNDFYNGTANLPYTNLYTSMASAKLNIGFTGTLTPTLKGAMRGYIYELIVFNTAITVAQRQAVEGYLAWKWGIQSSLPSTHPYFLAPP